MFVFLQPACQYANEADRGGMACSSLQGLRHIQDLTARNFCFREAPTGTPPVTMADNNWLQHAPGGSAQCTDTGITPRLEVRNIRNIRRHDSWSTEQLTAAIRAIHGGGGAAICTAARHYQILASSLQDHLYGTTMGRKKGRQDVLSMTEEVELEDYLLQMQELGYPLTIRQLRLKVAQMCETRVNPF
jgi:hypothetical protein